MDKRLTRKTFFGDYALEETSEKSQNTAINKLGRIEDILEELNVNEENLRKYLRIAVSSITEHKI